ncbi:hypothetical protein ACFOWA_01850 [Pedobacter lithocola]|uniref:Virulence factor SrfB n=1 Tax=Pedobacter lithocola TaxID=1908239 RepID=A0ABV8P5H7_9SPHI
MSVLNIFDATGDPNTGWRHTEKLNESAISQLKDKSAKTTNALNSVPSPFSRLHTFDTAFKLVTRDLKEGQDRASEIYKELVSDCLDALELSFNANYHESQGDPLTFVNWEPADLERLYGGDYGQQVFAKTVKTFIEADFGPGKLDISMIKYKGLAIAGSSPFTLMFTSSNLDKSRSDQPGNRFRSARYNSTFDLVNPGSGKAYFSRAIPFSKRGEAFKNYLVGLFARNRSLKEGRSKVFWDYLVAEGAEQVQLKDTPTKPNLSANGGVFRLGAVQLDSNADIFSAEIFNDHIIRVEYRLNENCFFLPTFQHEPEDRKFDFLLPLKPAFFTHFKPQDIPKFFSYELLGERVRVSYRNPGLEKPFTKDYVLQGKTKTEGKIVSAGKEMGYTFMLGIFPFIRVLGNDGSVLGNYNDFYKVSLAVDGGLKPALLDTGSFGLDFFRIEANGVEKISADGELYHAKREIRRAFETPDVLASIYYQVNGTHFDLINISLQKVAGLDAVNGLAVPKWKEKRVGEKQFDFSVDFGTTNTFIAYTDDPRHHSMPRPFDIDVSELQMAMLQQIPAPSGGSTLTESFWREPTTRNLVKLTVCNEFVPPVFLPTEPNSIFKMPFRTAVYQKKNIKSFNLFSDMNIHFGYQKTEIDSTATENQEIIANLKWNISSLKDLGSKSRVEKFIEELCLLFKYKVLLNNGNPKLTKLNWFIPQSLSEASIELYEKIWAEKVSKVLKSNHPPKRVYESEAPFYFLERTGRIENNDAVLSIDIGGGSTDAMLFVNKLPRLGTSFNFAGNILWSNGYNQLSNDAKDNGFYQKINAQIGQKVQGDTFLKSSMDAYSDKSTDEIINFWLNNDDKTNVTNYLRDPEFKIVYLLHYCSVLYHLAQLLKSNNYQEPTCVIFSGNGSKYIDFISNEKTLAQITAYIFGKVFEKEVKRPQVILPAENRKEATSYGGIFKVNEVEFRSKSYLGTTLDFERDSFVRTYNDVENQITEIKPSIKANIVQMLDMIEGLNEVVNFKAQLNIEFSIGAVRNFIEQQLDSNFDKGYGIRKEKISYEENVSDSLFFYPLIGVIFELSKITKSQLEDFTPKIRKYSVEPSSENTFDFSALTEQRSFNSVFELAVPTNNPNEATFSILAEDPVYQRAYTSREFVLAPVCELINIPSGHKITIKQHNVGKLRKDGNKWIVTEKLKLEFI